MNSFAAVIKSLIGQAFVISIDGVRRQVFEGEQIFAGEQVVTSDGGAVTLELASGEFVRLNANSSWQASANSAATNSDSPSAQPESELEQALAAGLDPTTALEPTAAGPDGTTGDTTEGGSHSIVLLEETGLSVEATIGFETAGITAQTSRAPPPSSTTMTCPPSAASATP
jgi:hypothetical protein